jgi:hypothetical protein
LGIQRGESLTAYPAERVAGELVHAVVGDVARGLTHGGEALASKLEMQRLSTERTFDARVVTRTIATGDLGR